MSASFLWLVTGASLAGVVLNIRKHRACFWLWAFTNAAWCIIDYREGLTAQSALFAIYFLLAIWGIVAWGKGKS